MIRIVTIVGARPQFVKASAVSHAMGRQGGIDEILIHTGQHYDASMSAVFFEELGIPAPAVNLGVGSGSHGAQTGEMLSAIEKVLLDRKPALVLVYGDTNSTLAGALAAVKLNVPVAHVEAGLRSFNRRMPEEVNRVLTDHVSSLLLCPTRTAVENLAREGIDRGVHHVGDVMHDVALTIGERAERSSKLAGGDLRHKSFVLATIHRAENTDDPTRLREIARALGAVSRELPVVLPLHPRTRRAVASLGITFERTVRVIEPVGMLDMTWLERHSALVITDSGGVQKEAYFHRTPCVTCRTETEWIETVESGWNRLASPDDSQKLADAARAALASPLPGAEIADYGNGHAAERVVELLLGVAAP